ncbi:Ankyrin repeat-containing protein [Octadecabacter temperatus]|uniref:Ankyrin repeats (3 copies) n=1 Tax=Octadecabacter temperatus TaxID=1458307 RepID=A0A0K0Y8X1_9RHOB|nr:ankyrin repeat domain-containing protein [Octadecabacter temperatus]AKS47360.1 Ankyrin repeats (3 copies) [Octadecabacter temperatus]SIO43545.1 Ankyrin repeat-containing protein [Octadecabacter temperatus]
MTNPLDKFRRAAKALKTEYETGLPDALTRIATVRPRSDGADLRHADYLHVIAQENNFPTWPVMKDAIETVGLDRAQKIQKLKIALHAGRTGVVAKLLEGTPDLAKDHFGLLCGLNDVKSVWMMLKDDPALASKRAGPFLPMVHLCKSRMFTVQPEGGADSAAIADMLVANGADVNAGSVENGDPLSPLYWALGHAGNMELATWLLENGANPNDGESLYHATELGHADGLRLLLTHGADPKQTNALPRAMDFDSVEMVTLLLEHGADPNEGSDAWTAGTGTEHGVPVLHQAARRMNSGPILDVLLDHGAAPSASWKGHSAYAFAKVFGNADLASQIEERGEETVLTDIEQMLATAASGQIPDGYINTATLPDEYRGLLREVLHLPGKLPHLKALVAIGLEWDRPDSEGITPVQAAGWNGLADVMQYFLKLSPNLGHVNNYGGTLLSTILHGAENNPQRANGDYIGCLQLALDEGVALPRKALDASGSPEIREFLTQWADDKPGQVVEYGIV